MSTTRIIAVSNTPSLNEQLKEALNSQILLNRFFSLSHKHYLLSRALTDPKAKKMMVAATLIHEMQIFLNSMQPITNVSAYFHSLSLSEKEHLLAPLINGAAQLVKAFTEFDNYWRKLPFTPIRSTTEAICELQQQVDDLKRESLALLPLLPKQLQKTGLVYKLAKNSIKLEKKLKSAKIFADQVKDENNDYEAFEAMIEMCLKLCTKKYKKFQSKYRELIATESNIPKQVAQQTGCEWCCLRLFSKTRSSSFTFAEMTHNTAGLKSA